MNSLILQTLLISTPDICFPYDSLLGKIIMINIIKFYEHIILYMPL